MVPLFGPPPIPYVDEFTDWVADTIFDGDMTTTNSLLAQLQIIVAAIRQAHPVSTPLPGPSPTSTRWSASSSTCGPRTTCRWTRRARSHCPHKAYLSYLDEQDLWAGDDDVADYARTELMSAVGLEQSAAMIGDVDGTTSGRLCSRPGRYRGSSSWQRGSATNAPPPHICGSKPALLNNSPRHSRSNCRRARGA